MLVWLFLLCSAIKFVVMNHNSIPKQTLNQKRKIARLVMSGSGSVPGIGKGEGVHSSRR